MNLETFFEKFDQFADAPNAVAKMRELVLQLAVQGKLAERRPSDVSVSVFLEALSAAKIRRIKADNHRNVNQAHNGNAADRPAVLAAIDPGVT